MVRSLSGDRGNIHGDVSRSSGLEIGFRGRLEDKAFAAEGDADADVVARIYDRFGAGGFLRLRGPFAAAILDRDLHRLVLARSPTFGREPAIFWRDAPFRFSTDPWELAGKEIDVEAVREWLAEGVWRDPERTAFAGLSVVPLGAALVISRFERKLERFWTFVPHPAPRPVAFEDARDELHRAVEPHDGRSYDDKVIRGTCRAIGHPVPLSEVAELGSLMGSNVSRSDLGMREVLGGTETTMARYVEAIAQVFDGSPKPSTLWRILRRAAPIDRALEGPVLRSELALVSRRVLARWSRHVPGAFEWEEEARSSGESFSGDRFADRRFLETIEPGLAARRRALESVGIDAPYLSREVVELAFTLPVDHFVHEGAMMRIAGSRPIRFTRKRNPSFRSDHPYAALPRVDFEDLEHRVDRDRWLGLGAFLEAIARGPI